MPAEFASHEEAIKAALGAAQQMPPDERKLFLRALFEQKIAPSPWFNQNFPNPQTQLKMATEVFGVPDYQPVVGEPAGFNAPLYQEPESMLGRILKYHGGMDQLGKFLGGAAAGRTGSMAGEAVGTGLDAANYVTRIPGRIAKEAINTGVYDVLGRQRPDAIGPPQQPWWMPGDLRSPGGQAQAALDLLLSNPMQLLKLPRYGMGVLRGLGSRIDANKAAAATENATFDAAQSASEAGGRLKVRYGPDGIRLQ